MQDTCPNCGSDKVVLITDTKIDYARDVRLGVFGVGVCNLPEMQCEKCGYTWNPYNNIGNLKDLLQ